MTLKTLSLGMMQTNCYVLYDEKSKDAIIVDPACDFDAIRKNIDALKLNVRYIVITHAHYDHIEALDELKQHTNALICIGEADAQGLSDPLRNLCGLFGDTLPETKADILLRDGDEIELSDNKLRIISTPGHTPGGICMLVDDILISGDTLFFESVGRSDFPGGSSQTLINSVKTKLFVLPDNTKVYPGHGPSTTIGHEKESNPFIW